MAAALRTIVLRSCSSSSRTAGLRPAAAAIAPLRRPVLSPHASSLPLLRSFSCTPHPRKNSIGPLPTFAPTSNPELDALLNHLRAELFIPPHLLTHHRRLIYKHKNHHILAEEPLYFDIGSETVQLTPKTTIPALPRNLFTKCVKLMRIPSDFNAIPALVLGYAQAGRDLGDKYIEMCVRIAGLNGRADILNQLLDQAEFNKVRITRDIARDGFQGYTVNAGISTAPDHANKAVRRARRLRELIVQQDVIVAGEYEHRRAIAGADAEALEKLGPKPAPIASDPICLGALAGITSTVSRNLNNSLDHHMYTAQSISRIFEPKSWNQLTTLLSSTLPRPLDMTLHPETRRAQFNEDKATIAHLTYLAGHLKSAEKVLATTAAHLSHPPASGVEKSLRPAKGAAVPKFAELAKRLRLEVPLMEQVTEKWAKGWEAAAGGEQGEAREKLERTRAFYPQAREKLEGWLQARKGGGGEQGEQRELESVV